MKKVVITSAVLSSFFVTGYQGKVWGQPPKVTITLTNQTFTGFNFSQITDYAQNEVTGTLTSISVNATLNASVDYTYADDICAYVDLEPLGTGGFLQAGGYSNLNAAQRYYWPNGGSDAVGTVVNGTITLTTPLTFTGNKAVDGTIWIGNAYGASGTSGTWTGTMTFNGISLVPKMSSCTAPTLTASLTNPSCFGGSSGAINLTASGGSPTPYTYLWSNGATSEDISSLSAGNYSVTVSTASGGCSADTIFTLIAPTEISTVSTTTNPSCQGESDGSISLMTSGGTGPYTYAWSNGGTGSSISGLAAGSYNYTITDSKSCTSTSTITLTDPSGLTNIITNNTGTTVINCTNPSISVTASGGGSYAWSGGAATTGAHNMFTAAGTYTVTVTNSGGCSATESITITQSPTSSTPQSPQVVSVTQPTCNPPVNGQCALAGLPAGSWVLYQTGTGGQNTYSGSGSTFTVPTLAPGVYRFKVANSDGCFSEETGPFLAIVVQY